MPTNYSVELTKEELETPEEPVPQGFRAPALSADGHYCCAYSALC